MPTNTSSAPTQDYSHIIQTTRDGALDDVSRHAHVVDVVARAIEAKRPIVIHLHGGLVPKESAYATVNDLQPRYIAAGLFPIFIVWRTGFLDAISNAQELVHRPVFVRLLERLLKYFVSKYADPTGQGKGIGMREEPDSAKIERELAKREVGKLPYPEIKPRPDAPDMSPDEQDDFIKSLNNDDELRDVWRREVEDPASMPGGKSLGIKPEIRIEAIEEGGKHGKAVGIPMVLAKHALFIAARVVKRYFKHRDHFLYTTIVEEILRELFIGLVGTEVWQFMKQDSADTFKEGESPERGGWLLMRLLGDVAKARVAASQPLPVVSIVAHSAGSIYAANLLRYLYQARESPASVWHGIPFQIEKLVFLAPAATCKTLSILLQLHDQQPLFKSFRMFSLTDADEHGYFEVKVLYSGSLLYIISGLLESQDDAGTHDMPVVGMQRYSRPLHPFTEPEVTAVWKFLRAHPDQLVWSGDARGPGLNCDTHHHGDFTRTLATVDSFLHFLT
jgi:hypothetical protein